MVRVLPGSVLLAVACLAWEVTELPAGRPEAGNVIRDSSLEGDGWQVEGGGQLTGSARTGARAGRVARSEDTADPRLTAVTGGLRPGSWLLSGWLRSELPASADRNYAATLDATWLDAGGVELGEQRGLFLNGTTRLWQYREASLEAPAAVDSVRLTFRLRGSVTGLCDIDDVCLTAVGSGDAMAPGATPVLVCRPSRSLFAPGEAISVSVDVPSGLSGSRRLSGELRDSRGLVLAAAASEVLAGTGQVQRSVLAFPGTGIPADEWLEARVSVAGPDSLATGSTGVLVRERPSVFDTESSSPFALLVGHSYTKRWLGARWQRPNFSWNERAYELGNRYGVSTLAMINETTSALFGKMSPDSYGRFVEESVNRLKGMIRWWQLGNEPPLFQPGMAERYVEVLKVGYQAAKRADPDCVIVMAGLTGLNVDPDMLARFLDAGGAQWCDVIDVHLYVDIPTMDRLLGKVRADMASRGVDKPIIITEVTASLGQVIDERRKAGHVYKRHVLAASHGVKQVYWFVMHWVNSLPGGFRHCGLIDVVNQAPWPAAAAYGRLSDALSDAAFVRRVGAADGVWLFEFGRKERRLWVGWSDADRPPVARIACGRGRAQLIDVAGHAWPLKVSGGLSVALTAEPLLIDVPAAAGEGECVLVAPALAPPRALIPRAGSMALTFEGGAGPPEFDVPRGLSVEASELRAAPDAPLGEAAVWGFCRDGEWTAQVLRLPVTVTEPFRVELMPSPSAGRGLSAVRAVVRNLSRAGNRGSGALSGVLSVVSPLSRGLRPEQLRRRLTGLAPGEEAVVELALPERPSALGRYGLAAEFLTDAGVRAATRRTLVFAAARSFDAPPRIDGELGEWGSAFGIEIGVRTGERQDPGDGPPADEADLSARAQLRWDKEALYLAVRVLDDIHCNEQRDGALWDGDGLQFALSAEADAAGAGRAELGCALGGGGQQTWVWHALAGAPTGPVRFPAAVVRREGETVYEVALPWSLLPGIEPASGTWFGFSLLVNERDTADRGWYGWHGGVSHPKDPMKLGQVTLVGE